MAVSRARARRIKFIIASLQVMSGILLVLFVLWMYHRHSTLQLILESEHHAHEQEHSLVGKEHKTGSGRGMKTAAVVVGVEEEFAISGERPEKNKSDNPRPTYTVEAEGGEDDDGSTEPSVQGHVIGEFVVISVGVIFIGLVLAGLFFDKLFPTECDEIDEEKQEKEDPPQCNGGGDKGADNPAREISDEEDHGVDGEEVIEMGSVVEGREKVE